MAADFAALPAETDVTQMNSVLAKIETKREGGRLLSRWTKSRLSTLALVCVVAGLDLMAGPVWSQVPTPSVLVTNSSVSGPTLGIPRWKGYMSPTNPDKFWLSFANGGGNSNDMCFTTNAGATWSTNTITIDGYMDFHLSLFGHYNDLYFTFPGG